MQRSDSPLYGPKSGYYLMRIKRRTVFFLHLHIKFMCNGFSIVHISIILSFVLEQDNGFRLF